MPANNAEIEKRLWDAADNLRANSGLRAVGETTTFSGYVI
jgi:hypothetical protein